MADVTVSKPRGSMASSEAFGDWQRIEFVVSLAWGSLGTLGRLKLLLVIVVVVAASYGVTFAPIVFSIFIDRFTESQTLHFQTLLPLAGFLIIYWVSHASYEALWILMGPIQQRIRRTANTRFFSHIINLPYDFHVGKSTGKLNEHLVQAQNGINLIFFNAVAFFLPVLLQVAFITLNIFFIFDMKYLLIVLGTMIVYGYLMEKGANYTRRFQRSAQKSLAEARGLLTDAVTNIETVKIFDREDFVAEKYKENLQQAEGQFNKFLGIRFIFGTTQITLLVLGLSISLGVAVYGAGRGSISIGEIVLLQMYFLQMVRPLQGLNLRFREIKSGLTYLDGIADILALPVPGVTEGSSRRQKISNGAIAFEKVGFLYTDRPILTDLSFKIADGETAAIVGATGAGKSTIVRLFLNLYEPTTGRIVIGDRPSGDYSTSDILNNIAVVPQDTSLFNDSLRLNILLGRPDASDAELLEAIRLARLENLVAREPEGVDTIVGERGLRLSGGERQRVGIARALIRRPKVFLFDEATSSLDAETEQSIVEDIRKIGQGRTKIIITHRLRAIIFVDRILVLDGGNVAEEGSHDSLLARNGIYAAMWSAQAGGGR